jgi:hypothetical protein
MTQLQQEFATSEMGFRVSLYGANPELLMSALGQKQTLDCRPLRSALPPKADIVQDGLDVSFVP